MSYLNAKKLTAIHPTAWEHPADRAALKALALVPGLDSLVKTVLGATIDRYINMRFLAEAVRVGPQQFSRVHSIAKSVADTLDLDPGTRFFVSYDPRANAGAWGYKDPLVVLHSSLLDMLDDEELAFVVAHELSHVASGHALYHTILVLILEGAFRLTGVAPDTITGYAIILALQEWSRKSELSADRGGLLAVQDPKVVMGAFMKLAGGSRVKEMDIESFVAQAEEYSAAGSPVDEISKMLLLAFRSHPMPVLRLQEIRQWVQVGEYQAVLDGSYARKSDTTGSEGNTPPASDDILKNLGDALGHYSREAQDGLNKFMKGFKL